MEPLEDLTRQLGAGRDLGTGDVAEAARALASEGVEVEVKAAFLEALARKGETAEEVAAFAREFLSRAVDPGVSAWSGRAIDIVGTGGDHAGGFNISSLVVLVLASAGVPVMKHGNRGVTSRCGSADLLAGLGVDIEAPPERVRGALQSLGFAFFFAPAYHPAFRHVAPARKMLAARGQRSIFNILGPLMNPGRPAHILLGSYADAWVPRLAGALDSLGIRSGLVAHGILGPGRGIDELTTATVNRVQGAGALRGVRADWRAEDFGLKGGSFEELKGGDLSANLALAGALAAGGGPLALADTIALNAAAAFWICGRSPGVREGLAEARELLLGGAVRRKIEATRDFFRAAGTA
jgi:anthranilate phosphoribosyltransferase